MAWMKQSVEHFHNSLTRKSVLLGQLAVPVDNNSTGNKYLALNDWSQGKQLDLFSKNLNVS